MKISLVYLASALCLTFASLTHANVLITPATGGTNISADSAANSSTASWTSLGPILVLEMGNARADISSGTLILQVPAGFEINAELLPSLVIPGSNNKDLISATLQLTDARTLTIGLVVSGTIRVDNFVVTNLQVRPLSGTVLSGPVHIYRPLDGGTAVIPGIVPSADGTTGTSFGDLSIAAGLVTQIGFTQEPGNAVVGLPFGQQPTIQAKDQYGNITSAGLPETLEVVTELVSGTGVLLGTVTNDFGSLAGNGTLSHSDLQINTVGLKQIAVTATGFLSVTSGVFNVFTAYPTVSIVLSNASPVLSISGDATQAYTIETSASVDGSWQTLNTVTTDALGVTGYVDVDAVNGNRFYRLLKQ